MVDFDRSRVGYTWDLVRLMVSLSLRQKKDAKGLLDKEVLKQMKKGYLRGFRHPDRPFSEVRELKDIEPENDETTTNAYLAANKKWAKEMRRNALPVDDADIVKLVGSWAEGRGDGVLNDYFIEEAGRGQGSMGFRGLFLVVLAPKNKSGQDRILLNIRPRAPIDTEWYKSPYGGGPSACAPRPSCTRRAGSCAPAALSSTASSTTRARSIRSTRSSRRC